MELFASQDPRSYSLYFDLNIWFRARKVTGTFEKRAPDRLAIIVTVTFYENEGFSNISFRDCSRNQNLGVFSSKHAGHIWKVICQLPKIVYREVEKK